MYIKKFKTDALLKIICKYRVALVKTSDIGPPCIYMYSNKR